MHPQSSIGGEQRGPGRPSKSKPAAFVGMVCQGWPPGTDDDRPPRWVVGACARSMASLWSSSFPSGVFEVLESLEILEILKILKIVKDLKI